MSGGMKLWRLKRRMLRHPEDGPIRVAYVRALVAAGEGDEIRDAAVEGIDLVPPASALELADILAAHGETDAASTAWGELFRRHPEAPGVSARWGIHLQSLGRSADACRPLRRAVMVDPSDVGARDALVTALRATGATGEIAEVLGACVKRLPTDPELLMRWGQALIDVGQRRRGLDALRRAHAARRDGRTVMALGVALGRAGASREAVTLFEGYMADHPDSLSAQINCGVAYGEIGDFTTAVRYLLDASHRAPHVAAIHQNLAVVFARMGQIDSAVDALRLAVRLEPGSAAAQLQLARMLARRGDLHEGMAAAALAASLAGDKVMLEVAANDLRSTLMQAVTGEYPALSSSDIDPAGRPSAISGDVMQFPLPNLLEFLRTERRCGLLQIVSMSGVGEIRLSKGEISSVSASQIPRLGEQLIEAGHLTPSALARSIASRHDELPIGVHLVRSGAVTAAQLREGLRAQALRGLMELLPWEQGKFAFTTESFADVPESWSTQSLLLDALRRLDEEGYADAADSIEMMGELFGSGESSPDMF